MPEPKFDKPKIEFSKSGVLRVTASDILLSRRGRDEIQKAANVAVSRDLRKSGLDKGCVVKSSK
jgi:hypothetical protein